MNAPASGALGARTAPSAGALVAMLSAAIFLSYIDRGLLALAGPLVTSELKLTATEFGLAISAFFWVYAPAQLLCGWMVDRFSPYRLFAAGLVLWGVATALIGTAGGLVALVVWRALLGLGQSFTFPGSSNMIARRCPAETRGWANGVVMAGLSGGQTVAALFGGLIMAAFGWREMCWFFGLVTLVWLLPWQAISAKNQTFKSSHSSVQIPYRDLLRHRALWGCCAGHFCNNYGFYFVITWLPLYLVKERGLSLVLMATLTATAYAVQTVVTFAGGWLSDGLIRRGYSESVVRKSLIVSGNAVKAFAILGIALSTNVAAMVFCLMITSIAIGVTATQNFAIPQSFAGPAAAGRWVGTQNFAANLAGISGPLITGLIVDSTGSYLNAFWVAGLVTIGAALFWGIVVPRIEPVRWRVLA